MTVKLIFSIVVASSLLGSCSASGIRGDLTQATSVSQPAEDSTVRVISLDSELDRINPSAYGYYVDAVLYEALGNPYRATESYRRALRFYPDSYEIRISLAENLYRMQRFDDALEALHSVNPQEADAWELRGDIYRAEGQLDSAVHAYRQAVKADSSRFELYSFLATAYARNGNLPEAHWAFTNMARLDPENYAVWLEIGRLDLRLGRVADAQAAFGRSAAIRSDAVNVMALIGLGEIFEAQSKMDSALILYNQALEADSANILVHRNMAGVYVHLDSLLKAVEHARIETRLAPLDRQSARRLGMLYYYVDSLAAADSVFNHLVEGGERNPVNHQYLGRIAMRQERTSDAVEQFRQVIQMADSAWEGWIELGFAYRASGDTSRAVDAFRSGLTRTQEAEPTSRLLMALGSTYEQSGKFDSAVVVFEELVASFPEFDPALNYLGYMLADSGQRLDYAQGLIERALKIQPDNAAYLDSYGWVRYRQGDYNQAREYLERAVALDSDPIMFDHLGDTYQALGETEEARRWWQKSLELDPDNARVKAKLDR